MNEQELTAALEELKTKVVTGASDVAKKEVNQAIASFEKDAKGLFTKEIEELKSQFKQDIKVVQDHADKLDLELQNGKSVRNAEKTFDQVLTEAMEKSTDEIEKFARRERKSFSLELDLKGVKAVGAVSTGNVTGSTVWGSQNRGGIVMEPSTRMHVRELIGTTAAGPGTDYYFMKENGAGEGSIAAVAEGATKPQFDVDLVEASVKFEVIAGWMVISRKALNNIPGISGFLSARLPEKLLDVEDQYIWYGTGVSPQIKGILTAGNFVAGSAAGATALAEKIITDLSVFEDTYKRTATDIVMRPVDYWNFFKAKASGSGEYNLPQNFVFVGEQLYVSGIPVSRTTSLTANDYVIGDFDMGVDLLVQEAMRIEFFEQDSTNVRTNQVTVRIEETIALPVYGSTFFMKGSSATA